MAATYKGLLTNNGKALIASATTSNKINYSHIAVGDGNGSVPTPLETRTALVNEKTRIALNVVEINPNNTNQIVCEAIIPTATGGFYIRELGLYADTTMVVNASYPPTYKPLADEGGAREIALKLVINIQNADVIALYLDDSLIYATREWVDTNYLRRNELVDDLTTDDATKPLSAKQGKKLQDEKFAIADLVNDLITGGINKALTAEQGKILFAMFTGSTSYFKIPNPTQPSKPWIIQMGSVSSSGSSNTVATFPLAFPNQCLYVYPIGRSPQAQRVVTVTLNFYDLTTATMNVFFSVVGQLSGQAAAGQATVNYIAIGN
jgi:hypothetical protein